MSNISENITLKKMLDAVIIPVKTAIPVGVIIVELITNSIKHAFPKNSSGLITLSLKKTNTGAVIEVRDDGTGLPKGVDIATVDSLGLKLVQNLVYQICGSIEIYSKKGTQCVIEFPIEKDTTC